MSEAAVLDDVQRARMNARYAALRAPTHGLFWHDGLMHFGVPAWVVKAYVLATVTKADAVTACAVAHFGAEGAVFVRDWRGSVPERAARAWAEKCEQVEMSLSQSASA